MIYRFGSCKLDTARRLLTRNDVAVHIEPQVYDLLCFLIENRERAVTKDEIFERIWEGRIVSEAVLTTRIRTLRKLIDDPSVSDSHIRTLHRVGYQFRGKVMEVADTSGTVITLDPIIGPGARPEGGEAELRHVVVIALQPRFAEGVSYDPDAFDTIQRQVAAMLSERLEPADDAFFEGLDGTVFAAIGTRKSRDTDMLRALRIAVGVRDGALGDGVAVAFGMAAGMVMRQGDAIRGDALLKASQAVATASKWEICLWPELVPLLPAGCRSRTEGGRTYLERIDETAAATHRHAPFVGRVVEIGLIERAMEATVEKGSGGCITLEGVAGVGKSRLVERAIAMNAERDGCHTLVYARELNAPGVLYRNILTGFGPLLKDCDAVLRRTAPDVRRTLTRMIEGFSPDAAKEPILHSQRLAEGTVALLRHASQEAPLLIVLEDAHWLDPESEKLAQDLAAVCADMQVILLVTARPSAQPLLEELALRAAGDIVALKLGPLTARQARELVDSMAGDLDEELTERLLERAQGNPLFLTRLTETAMKHGMNSLSQVPGSIHSVVQVQFDDLEADRKAALKNLSVLGERFERVVAERVYGPETLRSGLAEGFLRDAGSWLQFSHNLIRESIYETLPQRERKRLHTETAKALVEHDPLLAAEHAMRGDLSIAPDICMRVARDTFHFRRNARSVELISQALDLPCTQDQRAQLNVFLGSASRDKGEFDAAMDHFRFAVDHAASSTPAVFGLVRIAGLLTRRYRLEEAEEAMRAADGWLERQPGPGYLASEVAEMRSTIARFRRQSGVAVAFAQKAVELSDHPHSTARALVALAQAELQAGRFRTAQKHAADCRELVAEAGLSLVEADVLPVHMRCHWYADPQESRLEEAHETVDRCDWIGVRLARVHSRLARLEIALECGDEDTVSHDMEELAEQLTEDDLAEGDRFEFLRALWALSRGGCPDAERIAARFAARGAAVFLPLCDFLNSHGSARAKRPAVSPTPMETLWRRRLEGRLAQPEEDDAAGGETCAWRQFVLHKSSIRPVATTDPGAE